jgi:transcriptional regulator with XRE-family HTH domain
MTATVFAWDTDQVPRRPPHTAGLDEWAAWRVRYERERRGWSQGELARQVTAAGAPMQQQAIWKIENGTPPRKISLSEAVVLCKVFEIEDVAELGRPPAQVASAILGEIHRARQGLMQASSVLLGLLRTVAEQEHFLAQPLQDADLFYREDFDVFTGELEAELAQLDEATDAIRDEIREVYERITPRDDGASE